MLTFYFTGTNFEILLIKKYSVIFIPSFLDSYYDTFRRQNGISLPNHFPREALIHTLKIANAGGCFNLVSFSLSSIIVFYFLRGRCFKHEMIFFILNAVLVLKRKSK